MPIFNFDFRDGPSPFLSFMPYAIDAAIGTTFTLPGTGDENHLGGIGCLYLLAHLPIPGSVFAPALILGGAQIDLCAKRSADFDPKDYALRIVACTKLPASVSDPTFQNQVTNWAYTAFDFASLLTEDIETISHVVGSDPTDWQYMGVNPMQGVAAMRYAYLDLPATIAAVDATLHFAFVGRRVDLVPVGSVTIESIAITPGVQA